MAIDFRKVLEEKREIVWNELKTYIPAKMAPAYVGYDTKRYSEVENFHWKLASEYPMRLGKYGRPTLVLLTCEALGGDPKKAIKTAAAMEMSEEWILIHDDWEDDSDERRGKPTLHKIYTPELAINAGDTLHIIMWKILLDNYKLLGPDKTGKIVNEFYDLLSRAAFGQTAEIKWTQDKRFDLTEEDVYFILDGKTTSYTIYGPMRLGAMVAGATEEQLDKLATIGRPLGFAFQIRDDLLNLVGDRAKYGKEIGGDIFEGKITVMLIHLINNANEADKKKILSIMKKSRPEKTIEEVTLVIDLMHKYGSIAYGKRRCDEFAKQALSAFDKIKFFKENIAKEQLREAVKFMAYREK